MTLDSDLHQQQSESAHPRQVDTGNENSELTDFHLESVIGDAFLLFGFTGDKPKQQDTEPANESNENSDLNLEAAVGNAFLSLDRHFQEFENTPYKYTEDQDHNTTETARNDAIEKDLEERLEKELSAVPEDTDGQFLGNFEQHLSQELDPQLQDLQHLQDHIQHEQDHIQHDQDDEQEQQQEQQHEQSRDQQTEPQPDLLTELDLEAAIGNAFKSVTGLGSEGLDLEKSGATDSQLGGTQSQENTTQHQEAAQENHTGSNLPHGAELQPETLPESHPESSVHSHHASVSPAPHHSASPEDDKLESAIGEAFKSLAGYAEPISNSESVSDANIDDQLKEVQSAQSQGGEHDLTAAISASFEEIMGHKEAERRLSEVGFDLANIVQNVVQQMTGKEDESLADSEKKEIPHLDENILAHFQMEANKDEEKFEDLSLKDAIAIAVKSAMLKNAEQEEPEKADADLEKLQMNEILQNAFSMAMQNPQELLTSLNEEDNAGKASVSTTLAASVKEAIDKSETTENAPKSLSIAETLALHRSSMNAPRRDYSSINSLEESIRADPQKLPQMNPQLSNILSSLSHHIQSGNQSQNLMLVIRKMTNALMLNKSSSTANTAALDILKGSKSRPEDQKFLLESLLATKDFLGVSATTDLRKRALALITNVIGLFKESDLDVSTFTSNFNGKTEAVSDYYDSALSALTGFSSGRLRNVLAGVKPDLDSLEYKERIRIENRERKKKWREENAERNKDNDLRSRVIKRANNMFGEAATPEKKAWVEEEFNRRREKRLAKKKKEEIEKPLSVHAPQEPTDTKPVASVYADDERLVRRVSDIFSLVAETGLDDDPQAVLEATSAATAIAASSYAEVTDLHDRSSVRSAVSQILTNVLDSTVRAGTFMRIPFLSKIYNASKPSAATPDKSDLMSRLSALTGSGNELGQKSALEILQSSRKRLGLEFLTSELKKPRSEDLKENSPMSKIETEISQLRSSISASAAHNWTSGVGLKMPLYKKPEKKEEVKLESVSTNTPVFSPAKIGIASPSIMRKPGLQRPSYGKPTGKGASLGFPAPFSARLK